MKNLETIKALVVKNPSIALSTTEQKQIKGGEGEGQEPNSIIISDDWVMF